MTPYDEIYRYFLRKPKSQELKELLEEDLELGKERLFDFLESAIPKFTYCNHLSDRDNDLKQFNNNLTDIEKEILATLMVVEYLSPSLLREDLLANSLGSKDYQVFSPANQAKEIRSIRAIYENEAKSLMRDYYYGQGI